MVDDGTLRLAVLGDSTAAGIGDPVGNGAFRGFAPLLAQALGGPGRVRLVNTGTSGARTACVRREQLPIALAAQPHLAVLLVGINDTLRADFDAQALYTDLTAVVGALSKAGTTVLSAPLPPSGMGLPATPSRRPRARPPHRRAQSRHRPGGAGARRPVPQPRRHPRLLRAGHVEHRPTAPVRAGPPRARTGVRRPARGRRAHGRAALLRRRRRHRPQPCRGSALARDAGLSLAVPTQPRPAPAPAHPRSARRSEADAPAPRPDSPPLRTTTRR